MILQMIVLGLFIALVWFFIQNRTRLDKDRAQHHLASMLISVAAGQDEVSREDIVAALAGYSASERSARLSHAVKLAGSAVPGKGHKRVVALARELG